MTERWEECWRENHPILARKLKPILERKLPHSGRKLPHSGEKTTPFWRAKTTLRYQIRRTWCANRRTYDTAVAWSALGYRAGSVCGCVASITKHRVASSLAEEQPCGEDPAGTRAGTRCELSTVSANAESPAHRVLSEGRPFPPLTS